MINAITICVNYAPLLKLTLPINVKHFNKCLVVTAPQDTDTQNYCKQFKNVSTLVTDAFYRYGAKFNKGLAMEEGFAELGKEGWILVWDADIVLPDKLNWPTDKDKLYGAHRYIVDKPFNLKTWKDASLTQDLGVFGYFQLFNADSKYLVNQDYWYDVTFTHAGGCDDRFQKLWPDYDKEKITKVLHLGPRDMNWFGVGNTEDQKRLRAAQGWDKRSNEPTNDRIHVPGYKSDFVWHNSRPLE